MSFCISGITRCFCNYQNEDLGAPLINEARGDLQDLPEQALTKGPMDPAQMFEGEDAMNLIMEQAYHEITPGLFLGGVYTPKVTKAQQNGNFKAIEMPEFDCIISATVRPLEWEVPQSTSRYTFPIIGDSRDVSIESFKADNQENLKEAIQKMHAAITNNSKVFVHCQQGIDRSTTVVLAYLMSAHSISCDEALAHTRSWRHIADPMPIYINFLKETFIPVEL